jgi:hypothetical protein
MSRSASVMGALGNTTGAVAEAAGETMAIDIVVQQGGLSQPPSSLSSLARM